MTETDIRKYTNLIAFNKNLESYEINIEGKTSKGDGYLGSIIFLTITGRSTAGNQQKYNVVMKLSKENENVRKKMMIEQIFMQEVFVYEKIKPTFENFLKKNNVEFPTIICECLASQKTATNEIIILDNLKYQGFEVQDRTIPMTTDHFKLVLEAYARWHSLSFALKCKEPEVFRNLTKDHLNVFPEYFKHINLFQYLHRMLSRAKNTTTSTKILNKVDFDVNKVQHIVTDHIKGDAEDHVILHGDGWTNNFMFKLNEESKPSEVRIIDWQMSALASPVCDLSYFFYCCGSDEHNSNLEYFLRLYYNTLSKCLRDFGCDPKKIFSYDKLKLHWQKYSCYGFIISNFILHFSLCDSDEAPDLTAEVEAGRELMELFNFEIRADKQYLNRIRSNLINYVKYSTPLMDE